MKVNKDGIIISDTGKPLVLGNRPLKTILSQVGTTTTTTVGTTTTTTTASAPVIGGSGKVVIEATLSTVDNTAHADFAPFKWGKQAWFNYEVDDNFRYYRDMVAFIRGGTTEYLNGGGQTYPAKTFTDGCGNSIKWKFSPGCTHKLSGSPAVEWFGHSMSFMEKAEMWQSFKEGDGLGLHGGEYHNWNQAEVLAFEGAGWNQGKNLEKGNKFVWENTGFIPRIMITPNADAGYNTYLKVQGFLGNSSQNVDDGEPTSPNPADIWVNHLGRVSDIEATNGAFRAYLRTFLDAWDDPAQVSAYQGLLDGLIGNSSPTDVRFYRHGSHGFGATQAAWDGWCGFMNHLDTINNDRVAVISLQEALEYLETKRLLVKTETIIGNKLRIELDYKNIPDIAYWRDISLYIRTTASITNVTVTNAQGSSHNNATGLVNVYNKKDVSVAIPYTAPSSGKVTLKAADFFIDNTWKYSPATLINGVTNQNNYQADQMVSNHLYQPFRLVLDQEDYDITIDKIRLYNNQNTGGVSKIYVVKASDGTEVLIGTNTCDSSIGWREYTVPSQFKADSIVFESVSGYGIGSQVEVWSVSHVQPPANPNIKPKYYPLKQMLGINAHHYNFVNNVDQNPATTVNPLRYAMLRDYIKPFAIRYFDGAQGFQPVQDQWSFNPDRQGWQEETLANKLKVDLPGIEMWNSFLGQYNWMSDLWTVPDLNNYVDCTVQGYISNSGFGSLFLQANSAHIDPGNPVNGFDVWFVVLNQAPPPGTTANDWKTTSTNGKAMPVAFPSAFDLGVFPDIPAYAAQVGMQVRVYAGHSSQFNYFPDRNSYAGRDMKSTWADVLGKAAFVYASRRGNNPNVPDYTPYTPNGNTMLKGTGTSKRWEGMNEPTADWAGWDDFLNGRHIYQAQTVMFDGHMGQFVNCGAKQADPSFRVSTPGLATISTDLMRAIYKMSKFERGKNPDGTKNVPYDEIQYHSYSYTGGVSQYAGGVQGGLPPEWSNVIDGANAFVGFSAKYSGNRPCIVGEWGIDRNQSSPINAAIYGAYSVDEVRARWMLRTMIENAAAGIYLMCWYRYQMNQPSDINSAVQFDTMDLVEQAADWNAAPVRLITGDYFTQLHEIGDYVFDAFISETPKVRRFINPSSGAVMYIIWARENALNEGQWGTQKPQFSEATGTYNLVLANGTNYRLRQFTPGSAAMSVGSILTVSGGAAPIAYGSKPLIVEINPVFP